ncbi:MAG: branched-chain amino acid ABC transporter permease [Candidatus Hecatellales archaeon]|nr:MAG: branched-chain amino acid ABC transporter permease [Candidatus Hecatellales archaeon]
MLLPQVILEGVMVGGIYALAATGLTLVLGVMRVLNLAHGHFMMIAMYLTYFLYVFFGLDPFLSIPISMLFLFAVGMALQRTIVRPVIDAPVVNQMILMIGLLIFLENMAAFLWTHNYRALKGYEGVVLSFFGFRLVSTRLAAFAMAVIITVLLYILVMRTKWGRAVRACSTDPDAAMLMGINVPRIRLQAFGLGVALAGAAGSLITTTYYIFPSVGMHYIIVALVIVVLGGMGNIFGALAGGIILGLVEALTSFYVSSQLKLIGVFIVFILLLLFRPEGLFARKRG